MKTWLWPILGGLAAAAMLYFVLSSSCERQQDKPGHRADSVLADTMRYVRQIASQDSTLARLDSVIRATDRDRDRWKRTALASLARDDADQAAVDSTVEAGVPDSVAPAVFWKDQWETQRRITARLRSETVPALLATIAADSLAIVQRDTEKLELESQRDFARMRAREVTREFQRYRDDSKPGIDLGLFRVPEWVGYAAAATAGVGLTLAVTK
jgi:hypothetical protein